MYFTQAIINAEGDPEQRHPCEPGKVMMFLAETYPRLMEIHADAADEHRIEWSCIVTFDEMVTGDKLIVNNRRNARSLCFSFLELDRCF